MRSLLTVVLAFVLVACSGGEKEAQEPAGGGEVTDEPTEDGSSEEEMIPVEKFDEIKRTFERKQIQVSRCFVAGVEAGEIQKNDKGTVTVGAVITPEGKAQNVRIVETTFKSPTLEKCVKETVAGWVFTTLPRELEYSYQYRLERF
ncbi:MAG: AgmX/PglI C-terminal domain-containing protein [Deltaproteobacteria bacterium]|nr:AgmX/PglI C-terminal domain-containing protein [Deltaproteobacteria bacterium]